jgi:2-polyprenyl-3-methyl-5-hydroxy-6-metoxy-1,4-benzoquinol methylase
MSSANDVAETDPNPAPLDLAGEDYWSRVHANSERPTFGTYRPERLLDQFIASHLRPRARQQLIELGAGNSAFLPHLATTYGYDVAGLDYSSVGCALARRNLEAAGASGDIREANLFEPPAEWIGAFDVVASFGVVEHFDDTVATIRACAAYAKPNGRILTVIPNMRGLPGLGQRMLSSEIYLRHRPLTAAQLAAAHARAGLDVESSTYLAGINAGTLNPSGAGRLRLVFHRWLRIVTTVIWWVEDKGLAIPPNRFTSPWIVTVAKVVEVQGARRHEGALRPTTQSDHP